MSLAQQRIRISLADTRAGLSADKIAQLFQSFNRLGQEDSTEEGTGAGLVVSKRVMELMCGEIGVESTVGQGSVFWIDLQSSFGTALDNAEDALATLIPAPIEDGKRIRTLLYVEDNPANMLLMEKLVARRSDLRLLSAREAKLGIALATTHRPDAILMDINLPGGMSGIKALKMLQANPLTNHIPVIAISANAMPCPAISSAAWRLASSAT